MYGRVVVSMVHLKNNLFWHAISNRLCLFFTPRATEMGWPYLPESPLYTAWCSSDGSAQITELGSNTRLTTSFVAPRRFLHSWLGMVTNRACRSRLSNGVPLTSDKPLPAASTNSFPAWRCSQVGGKLMGFHGWPIASGSSINPTYRQL